MRIVAVPTRVLLLASCFALLTARASTATAAVYTWRDARGVSHFSSVAQPGWTVFHVADGEHPRPPAPRPATREDPYHPIIREYAVKFRVERALVKAMIRVESAFDPKAVSPQGARGLMQLMPRTARRHGVANLDDPRQNIRGGVGHLRSLLDRFHNDVTLTIAAYHAGAANVSRYGGLPPFPQTRTYVAKVLRLRREYLREEDAELDRG
jgi:soluble lytic murein transglycosylase-like protein